MSAVWCCRRAGGRTWTMPGCVAADVGRRERHPPTTSRRRGVECLGSAAAAEAANDGWVEFPPTGPPVWRPAVVLPLAWCGRSSPGQRCRKGRGAGGGVTGMATWWRRPTGGDERLLDVDG